MTMPTRWLQTSRGRKEFGAIAVFVLLSVVVPLCRTELYPFSRAPMFADAPRRYCEYRIMASDGRTLDPREFSLQRNYWGNPLGIGAGFLPADTVDRFGEVSDPEIVTARIASSLVHHPELEFVDVFRAVIGPLESGGVGVVETECWRVSNPLAWKTSGP
jgi:hypothetical protein